MKHLGLLLLVLGIAIAAAFGSKNPESIHQNNIDSGRVAFLGALEQEAFDAYCAALAELELEARDDCPPPEGGSPAATDEVADTDDDDDDTDTDTDADTDDSAADDDAPAAAAPAATYEQTLAANQASVDALRGGSSGLPADVAVLRGAWIDAIEASVEPRAAAAVATTPSPGTRFSSWSASAGVPFLFGILLVVIGAVIARRTSHAENAKDSADEDGKPVDFGVLLGEIAADVQTLADEVATRVTPTEADFIGVRDRIDALKLDKLDRLISTHRSVERRYGLATYAAIFSPLSGGERMLNRAWAALTDRHWPEALRSLTSASAQLAAALAEVPAGTPKA